MKLMPLNASRWILFRSKQTIASSKNRNVAVAFEEPKFDDGDENSGSSFVRITTPQRMDDAIRRRLVNRQLQEAELERRRRLGTPIIACSRPAYSLFKGRQTYSKNTPLTALASHGWKHPRSKDDTFTVNAFSKRSFYFESQLSDAETCNFEKLALNPLILDRLSKVWGIDRATGVQELVIPHILQRENVQFAAESGSGKTFAYLLPLAEFAVRENWQNSEEIRSVVLAPGRELVQQISNTISQFSLEMFRPNTNVFVSTPGSFLKTFPPDQIASVKHVVVDEADTLLDDSFAALVQGVFERFQTSKRQVIFASATMPQTLREVVGRFLPDGELVSLTTSRLHRLATHISHKFVRCGPSLKSDLLVKLVRKIKTPTIIFCNRAPGVTFVVRLLIDNGIPPEQITVLDGQLSMEERDSNWGAFVRGDRLILVATDLASRGLDTPHVRQVINFDMPHAMSDYIHRVGRLGRAVPPSQMMKNSNFLVTNFVTYHPDVEICWQLEAAARRAAIGVADDKETELPGVDANIKRQLKQNIEERRAKQMQKTSADVFGNKEGEETPPFPSKFLGSKNNL